MPRASRNHSSRLTGHALRNAKLRQRALERAHTLPPLASAVLKIRAGTLGMTRQEFARRSGISRGTLRDLELGVHLPTRRTLRQFMSYCQRSQVSGEELEEVRRMYAGRGNTLEELIARLELRAGSPRVLAQRVGISPATLWEYRRGNFPIPVDLLRRLCQAMGEDPSAAEALWHESERQRLLDRGYPPALAEFWVLCARAGYAEKHLLDLGLATADARRLRYLETPPWPAVARVARKLCRGANELRQLQNLWERDAQAQEQARANRFGQLLQQLRKQRGLGRRELADLFGIGGKKPARIIKYIEEDGFYSTQAYPAGLAALVTDDPAQQARLLELWHLRRRQFHRRRRPETRIDLRLMRERFGFRIRDMKPILGYSSLEYQRIERGTSPLPETARARILHRIQETGLGRIEALLQQRSAREAECAAWQTPQSIADLIVLLARREGGLIPLTRLLKKAGVKGMWMGRLRAIARGEEIPAWKPIERIASACGVSDLDPVHDDWQTRYRSQLKTECDSPLGVEIRLLIAESAPTLRAFSPRLGFNYSVLIRNLQKIDRDEAVKWSKVERILRAAALPEDDPRWQEIHALWYTAGERRKKSTVRQESAGKAQGKGGR